MSEKKEKSKLSLSAKAKKFDVPLGTLKKVFRRGVAAWNSGHRPGTTPQQWGHARVNSYLRKGKTYHTADKDLHEDINKLFERLIFVDADPEQIAAADEIRKRGGDEMEVWRDTGVWVAPNGRRVTEISDDKLTIRSGSGNAKDYISHPDLTNKFPNHLDKMTANIAKPISTDELNNRLRGKGGYEHAYYTPPQIGIDNTYTPPHISISGGTDSSMADATVHELQHSMPGYGGADPASTKNFDDYWNNPNERIARLSAWRRRLDPEQRRAIFPGLDLIRSDDQNLASRPRDDTPGSATPAPAPAKPNPPSPPPAKPNPPSPPTGSGSNVATEFRKRLEQQRQQQQQRKNINERLLFLDADPEQAAAASELEKSGESPEQIWKKEGAYKDPYTGKWTKEISDKAMDLPGYQPQSGLVKSDKKTQFKPAQAAIKHDALFKAVPGVKATQVKNQSVTPVERVFGNLPYGGVFRGPNLSRGRGTAPSIHTLTTSKKGALDKTVHELQHNVDFLQGNLRRPGYNTATFNQNKTANVMRHSVDPNEVRANATMSRRELDDKQRRERFPLKDYKLGGSVLGGKVGIPLTMVPKSLRESQLVGTDEYRDYALAMTPGQDQEIQDAFPPETYGTEVYEPTTQEESTNVESNGSVESGVDSTSGNSFRAIRKKLQEQEVEELEDEEQIEGEEEEQTEDDGAEDGVDFTPNLKTTKARRYVPQVSAADSVSGFPVLGIAEAVEYHQENDISLLENIFRPGSDMFFAMILEAKRLYAEGEYTPQDDYEQDLLESDIGEVAEYNGAPVLLDFPYEEIDEELDEACWDGYEQKGMKKKGKKMVPNCVPVSEENDPTKGKGIGKPFRSRGGGAVYVRSAKGNVIKVNFSQSGMRKRFNEPARVKSFVARHNCYGNKDKTSASYWACRWPRYFSDTGQQWW